MKRGVKIFLLAAAFAVGVALVFLVAMSAREWKPAAVENVMGAPMEPDTITCDTIKLVSWNIGYAGLGDDMDFFYDGGKSVRTGIERTRQNLKEILVFLRGQADADFILLQEVDFDSKRSYHMNQYDSIRVALPEFMGWWGLNYVSDFVPIPVPEPAGKVRSGVALLSKYAPDEIIRLQYPSSFPYPVRLFNLKRCLLTASFHVAGSGNMLYVNNTHNTAYDTGGMRSEEMAFLRNYLEGKPLAITAGDWNCNPPGYVPTRAETEDSHFSPMEISRGDFPADMSFVYDPTTLSNRYGYEPYDPATTTRTLLDFALCGPGIEPLSVETVDLGFRNSDHNPVIFTFAIRRQASVTEQ